MPQTYMRTSSATSGLNSCLRPVKELWILSMGLESSTRGLRGHELEQLRQFRPMRLTGQCHTQRHEDLGPFATRALLEGLRQRFQIRSGLIVSFNRRGKEAGA